MNAVAGEGMYKNLFKQYSDLQEQYVNVNRDKEDLYKGLESQLEKYKNLVENYTFLSKENEKMETDSELTDKALKDIKDALECSICCEIIDEHVPAIITRCGHVFHTQCQASHEKTTPNVCPNCRSPMHPSQKFTGFTAIAAALKTLHDKRDAQCCTYTD